MQGVFMGHLGFYNKNQIRDKLLLVLIFLKQASIIVARLWNWIRKTVLHNKERRECCNMREYYEVYKNDGRLE